MGKVNLPKLKREVSVFEQIVGSALSGVIGKIENHLKKHPNAPYSGRGLLELEKAVSAKYDAMGVTMKKEFRTLIPEHYQSFYNEAKKDLKETILSEPDIDRINYFLKDSYESVMGATQRMKQSHLTHLRRMSADVFREASLTGATTYEVSKTMYERAMQIPGFQIVDKGGNTLNPKSYFKMLARTKMMEASNAGYMDSVTDESYDVVVIDYSGNPCPRCAVWEGQHLSITGKTKGLPTVEFAKSQGLFHPNCTHSMTVDPLYGVPDKEGEKAPLSASGDFEYGSEKHKRVEIRQEKAFSKDERFSLGDYSASMYKEINNELKMSGSLRSERVQRRIQDIDSVLKKSKTVKDTLLYRGINSDELYNDIISGDPTIKSPGFTSMTSAENVAEDFSRQGEGRKILLSIDIPKGTHVIDMRDISAYAEEKEVLGGRDFILCVNSFEDKNGILYVKARAIKKKV